MKARRLMRRILGQQPVLDPGGGNLFPLEESDMAAQPQLPMAAGLEIGSRRDCEMRFASDLVRIGHQPDNRFVYAELVSLLAKYQLFGAKAILIEGQSVNAALGLDNSIELWLRPSNRLFRFLGYQIWRILSGAQSDDDQDVEDMVVELLRDVHVQCVAHKHLESTPFKLGLIW